jgi:outer membrane immunogenic protein
MDRFAKVALVALLTVLPTATVRAADSISYPTSTAQALPVHDDSGFDWSGFYAGLYGVGQSSPAGGTQYGLGLDVGANITFDFYLVGAEVSFKGLTGGAGGTSYADVLARGGLMVTDEVLLYAAGGYGIDTGAPVESDLLLGAGAEFAMTDNVSLRAQYLHGFPVSGGNDKNQVSLGANFHF